MISYKLKKVQEIKGFIIVSNSVNFQSGDEIIVNDKLVKIKAICIEDGKPLLYCGSCIVGIDGIEKLECYEDDIIFNDLSEEDKAKIDSMNIGDSFYIDGEFKTNHFAEWIRGGFNIKKLK